MESVAGVEALTKPLMPVAGEEAGAKPGMPIMSVVEEIRGYQCLEKRLGGMSS